MTKNFLAFTGERMIPEQNKKQGIYAEHIIRYLFATQFVEKKTVLDVACGSGYGSALLADAKAKKVIGIDISDATILHAKNYYSRKNIDYREGDATHIDLEDNSVDVVVSFETIEHILDYKLFLKEVRRVLKPEGIFLVSTPNKAVYPSGNKYHIKEFYVQEFQQLLEAHFPEVVLEKQKNLNLNSLFSNQESLKKSSLTIAEGLSEEDPLYVLALCGKNLKQFSYSGVNFLNDFTENERNQHLKYLKTVIETRDEQLGTFKENQKRLEEANIYKDSVIKTRDEQVRDYQKNQEKLERIKNEKESLIETKNQQIKAHEKNQKRLEEATFYKDSVIKTRDEQMQEYQKNQKRLEGDVQHQKNLREKEQLEKLKKDWNVSVFPFYDIIIPVYNGYDFLKECVDSLFKKTNYPNFRVVIIDDRGGCEKTEPYLKKINEENEKILLLRNEKNLGFVKTVNRGMKLSQNEIVLLNSDTVLTQNWLLKMHQARLRNPLAVSVTPLTNNGTICSVPNWLQDNELPQNLSLDEYAELIEKISLKQYPILPTAVGFCMLITRESLELIGYFDEASFGKGYGEENDWCVRAIKSGYTHILDDVTFVQHKGSMSFGNSPQKQKKLAENLKTLNKKHPEYAASVETFIQKNPMLDVIQNIQLNLEFNNGKKNILYVLHNDIKKTIGGTELHVSDLVHHFKKDYNIFVFFPKGNQIHIRQFANKNREYKFEISNEKETPLSNPSIEKIFQKALDYFKIEFVHFHHLKGLPLSLLEIANKSETKVIFSIHDYFFYCPCPQLLTPEWKFCKFKKPEKNCEICLSQNVFIKKPFKNLTFLKNRREFFSRNLKKCEKIITPSQFVSKKLQHNLAIPDTQIKNIYHGICNKINNIHEAKKINDEKQLNIAFLGSFTKIKGASLFEKLVQTLKKEKRIQFKIIGEIGEPLIFEKIKKRVIHKKYTRKNLSTILKEEKIDLILLPSIWEETFCYTLSEALMHKIPVITTALGAQEERIKTLNGGWYFPINDFVEKTENLLLDLVENKQIIKEQSQKIKSIKTQNQMLQKYEALYKKNRTKEKRKTKKNLAQIFLNATRKVQKSPKKQKKEWKDQIYWFLVKVKLINTIRPIYYQIKKRNEKK